MEQVMIIMAGALIVEALVQCLKATPITFKNPAWWEVIASIVGVGIAIIMHINLIDAITLTQGMAWTGGMIAAGVIIGRGASFVHDLMNKLKSNPVSFEVAEAQELFEAEQEENQTNTIDTCK